MNIKIFLLTTTFIMHSVHASELPVIPLSDLVNAALKHQPSVAVSYYETEKKSSDLDVSKAALYPTLDLTSGLNNTRKESSGIEKILKIKYPYRIESQILGWQVLISESLSMKEIIVKRIMGKQKYSVSGDYYNLL